MSYQYNKKFKIINTVCFNNKLPKIKIQMIAKWPKHTDRRTLGQTHSENKDILNIVLLRCKKKGDMTLTLMHEMLHCRYILNGTKIGHSKEFKKREWKLAKKLLPHCPEIHGCIVN